MCFLGYSDEHKGYRCWDPVDQRVGISRDVTFDESRPFYPRPSSSTFSVEDISFITFLDTPPSMPHIPTPSLSVDADMAPSSPTVSSPPLSDDSPPSSLKHSPSPPSSMMPSPSAPMSSPSPPPVIPTRPSFPFHYTRRPRLVDASTDEPSTFGELSSSSQPTYGLRARPCPQPDRYSPSRYGLSVILEPTSYHDVVVHPEWQLAMAEEIAALEHTST